MNILGFARRIGRGIRRRLGPNGSRLGLYINDASGNCLTGAERRFFAARGFRAYTARFYGLNRTNVALYVSDLQRAAMRSITPRYNVLFDDKMIAEILFNRVIKTPRTLAHLDAGTYTGGSGATINAAALSDIVRFNGRVMLKDIRGGGGAGVSVLSDRGGALFHDEQPVADPAAFFAARARSIITEFIVQHAYARALFADSVNTIRVVTLRDPDTRRVFTAAAVQRIGNAASAPVDNFSRGGLTVDVDLASGALRRAARCDKYTGAVEWLDHHPDSGARITGVRIPNWATILEQCTRGHATLPQIELIAWDIALDETGEPMLVEANASTDVDLLQVHRPLLAEPRVRRFFEHHGVGASRLTRRDQRRASTSAHAARNSSR